jgi:hypothetical protein
VPILIQNFLQRITLASIAVLFWSAKKMVGTLSRGINTLRNFAPALLFGVEVNYVYKDKGQKEVADDGDVAMEDKE